MDHQDSIAGTMSVSRRRFLVFATFDLIFSSVLWIIFTVTSGGSLKDAFSRQIELAPEDFLRLSLFDTVVLAFLRFVLLVLFYAILKWNHWFPICVCVCITSIYMVLKILYFKFHASGMEYALIVCCFVIPWIELYVFDFKVRRNERAEEAATDRADLLANDQLEDTSRSVGRQPRLQPDDPFFSAIEYTTDNISSSDDELLTSDNRRRFFGWGRSAIAKKKRRKHHPISVVDKLVLPVDFVRFSHNAMSISKSLLETVGSWSRVRDQSPLIACDSHKIYGKVYYVEDVIDCSRDQLFSMLVTNSSFAPDWNASLAECRVLRVIDQVTDVVYNVSNPALGGAISSRDYVDVRRWEMVNTTVFCALMSANTDLMPEQSGKVRGKNGPTLIAISPIDANNCTFKWIMNTTINGRLPRTLIDQTLSSFIVVYVKAIHTEVAKLPKANLPEV